MRPYVAAGHTPWKPAQVPGVNKWRWMVMFPAPRISHSAALCLASCSQALPPLHALQLASCASPSWRLQGCVLFLPLKQYGYDLVSSRPLTAFSFVDREFLCLTPPENAALSPLACPGSIPDPGIWGPFPQTPLTHLLPFPGSYHKIEHSEHVWRRWGLAREERSGHWKVTHRRK